MSYYHDFISDDDDSEDDGFDCKHEYRLFKGIYICHLCGLENGVHIEPRAYKEYVCPRRNHKLNKRVYIEPAHKSETGWSYNLLEPYLLERLMNIYDKITDRQTLKGRNRKLFLRLIYEFLL